MEQFTPATHPGVTELNLARVVRRIVNRRKTLILITVSGLLLGILLALLLPPYYKAEAVFLPPSNTVDLSVAANPAAALLGKQDPTDMYLGMLGSRSVADDIIDQLNLMAVFKAKDRPAARTALAAASKFTVNKNSLISVSVTSGDPKLAAAIANAYLEALYRLNGSMASSGYRHRQEFFEAQLEQQKNVLSDAEIALKQTQENTRVVLPEGEAMAGLSATAQLQAEIGAAETSLAQLRLGATEDNPTVVLARTRVAQLRGQLARQQSSTQSGQRSGLASTANLPGLTLEYARKAREVKLQEGVYDALTQQYQKARIAASDPGPQFQIVDKAVVPERKSGPPRKLLTFATPLLFLILGLVYLLIAPPAIKTIRSAWIEAHTHPNVQ